MVISSWTTYELDHGLHFHEAVLRPGEQFVNFFPSIHVGSMLDEVFSWLQSVVDIVSQDDHDRRHTSVLVSWWLHDMVTQGGRFRVVWTYTSRDSRTEGDRPWWLMVLTPVLTMVGPASEAHSRKDDTAENLVVSGMSTWGLFGPRFLGKWRRPWSTLCLLHFTVHFCRNNLNRRNWTTKKI
jgi:hypothetical protein